VLTRNIGWVFSGRIQTLSFENKGKAEWDASYMVNRAMIRGGGGNKQRPNLGGFSGRESRKCLSLKKRNIGFF